MHINKLLRDKHVSDDPSDFLKETSVSEAPEIRAIPHLDEFLHHLAQRDFASALEVIQTQNKFNTNIFLIRAFADGPELASDFLYFWKAKFPENYPSLPITKNENLGEESFDSLEFNLNFNGHTYSADFEENPRVRLSELHLSENPSSFKWLDDSEVEDDQGTPLVVSHPTSRLDELKNPVSPAFQKWIAPSEVQQLVYHATNTGRDFNKPHAYSHFGTLDASHQRIPKGYSNSEFWDNVFDDEAMAGTELQNNPYVSNQLTNARIMPFYLRIVNGLEVIDHGGDHSAGIWIDLMKDVGVIDAKTEAAIAATMSGNSEAFKLRLLTRVMKKLGYDGFVYQNEVEDKGEWSYVPIYPWQIVSAIQAQGPEFTPPQHKASDPRQMSLFGESKMNEQTMGLWGSGWYNPFSDSNVKEEGVYHIDLIERFPEVFGFDPKNVEGKSENELTQLYIPLIDNGWIRYYWAETTIVINGSTKSLKEAQKKGFFNTMFKERTPRLMSFEISDGEDVQFTLPTDKQKLARFLVTFTTAAWSSYEQKKQINTLEDLNLPPGDDEIF